MPSAGCRRARPVKMRLPGADNRLDALLHFDKLPAMATSKTRPSSPAGAPAAEAAAARGRRSEGYRSARDEYAAIEQLRKVNWIAAHIRERRYELELTQQQVAERAGTSHSFISKLESGTHIPTIPVLTRIFAVLDERLLIGIERDTPDGEPEREIAAVPELVAA